jgi:hypothetical protein
MASDSVVTYASSIYQSKSLFRRLLMGSNYREEWGARVKVPVFRFSHSGFTIEELGGGMQTRSLHILDSLGKEWALRTVDKDVMKALPPSAHIPIILKASQDLISAAFPYGAPIAGELVNAVGLRAARPQVYFVADDPALGQYRSIFANTLCTLEERDPGFEKTDDSFELLKNVTENNLYKIQQQVLLKARLMDMLMADWDRHADNWRWGLKDSAGLKYYYAIPRDRDWVFYQGKGLVPKLVQLTRGMRCFISFTPRVKNIKDLSWKAWTIDKQFLNEMTAQDWQTAVRQIQASLTDQVIEEAVRKMPVTVFELEGEDFINTLKSRRDNLEAGVMKYYRFLNEEVLVNGSNADEMFSVSAAGEGITVSVYKKENKQLLYQRRFSPSETYFITLNGLGGNDDFEVQHDVTSKIRLNIYGGEGTDHYNLKGSVRTKIYDTVSENNTVVNKGIAKVLFK